MLVKMRKQIAPFKHTFSTFLSSAPYSHVDMFSVLQVDLKHFTVKQGLEQF